MKRYYVLYTGQVQGVGFRYTISQIVIKYNLTGFVSNEENGNVILEIQGNKEDLDQCLKEIYHNDSKWIIIDDYFVKEIPLIEESYFSIY